MESSVRLGAPTSRDRVASCPKPPWRAAQHGGEFLRRGRGVQRQRAEATRSLGCAAEHQRPWARHVVGHARRGGARPAKALGRSAPRSRARRNRGRTATAGGGRQ